MTYANSWKISRDPSIQGRLKSKRTFSLLLVLLCVDRSCSTVSNIVWSNVKSLTVERKILAFEEFTLHMKAGHQCTDKSIVDWCAALQGYFTQTPCTCSCLISGRVTFIPSMQSCINKTLAATFGGCSRYFGQSTLLAYPGDPVNVKGTTARAFPVSSAQSCILSQDYFIHDYNGFQKKWIRASDGFFSLSMSNNANSFDIKWQSVSTVPATLTGRIVRLMVTCSRGSSSSSGCVLFKVGGTVTYLAPGMSSKISATSSFVTGASSSYLLSSSLSSSSVPPILTSSSFSVMLPATSALLPSPSVPKTSNAGMPLPASKTKLQSLSDGVSGKVTTKMPHLLSSMAVHPVGPSSSLSSSSVPPVLTSSSLSVKVPATSALLPSPSVLETSNAGIPLPASKTKLESLSDDVSGKVTTKKPHLLSSMAVHPVEPLETSSLVLASSTAVINKPGGRETQIRGKDNGVVIGAAVGSAVVLGAVIVIIIVFWKRRRAESMKRPRKEPKEVKNPVYGTSVNEIPLERSKGSQTMPSSVQDNPLYQGLVISNENSNGTAIYSNPEGDYDNCNVYQSLEKEKPGSPVYQSLNASQEKAAHTTSLPKNSPRTSITGAPNSKVKLATGTPKSKPGATGNPYQKPIVPSEPVYNVVEGQDGEEDYEALNGDSLYNILEGPDATYESSDMVLENSTAESDPVCNVVEEAEDYQNPPGSGPSTAQESLYNVLEDSNAGKDPLSQQSSSDLQDEPVYNILEESDSGAGPSKPCALSGHDNPTYEQTLEFDDPYAAVHRPGPQRESLYEPLREPSQDLYAPLG